MKETICIVDIENEQQEYAKCLSFIKAMDGFNNMPGEQCNKIGDCAKLLKIQIAEGTWNSSPRYLEDFSDSRNDLFLLPFTMDRLMDMRVQPVHFHVRIHLKNNAGAQNLNYSEFIHFQYLSLMLIYLDSKGFFGLDSKRRITAFIVPSSGDTYPFENKNFEVDYDTYEMVSHYLRLMSKKHNGVIYGVAKNHNKSIVTALNFHTVKQYEDYFPVIYIDDKKYKSLFVDNFPMEKYKELFSLGSRNRFGKANEQNSADNLIDICAETAIKHIRSILQNLEIEDLDSSKMQNEIYRVVENEPDKPLMQFCLFAYILSLEGIYRQRQFKETIKNTWNLADNIQQGLRQIIQNSVQYSQLKACIFSFCLHKSKKGETKEVFKARIGKDYPNTEFLRSNHKGVFEALEIFVSDINEKVDMLDSFVANLQEEKKIFYPNWILKGHDELLQKKHQLAIRNFFSEFKQEDCKREWADFRQEDLVAHVGLSLLALTAQKCKASVKVLSSKNGILESDKSYFYKAYNCEQHYDNKYNQEAIIPGTQIALLIPVNDWNSNENNGLGKLIRKSRAVEDYAGFAEFLNFIVHIDPIDYKEGGVRPHKKIGASITDAKKKNQLVAQWSQIWKKHIYSDIEYAKKEENKYVFDHDLELICEDPYLAGADYVEVCLKGLISALDIVYEAGIKLMIALTNLPDYSVELFCKMALLLGAREFPENLQLCLCEKSVNNMVVMVGKNYEEAIYNSHILSMEYGTAGFTKNDYVIAKGLRDTLLGWEESDETRQEEDLHIFPFDAVLRKNKEKSQTLFEERIQMIAENPLDQADIGYKLDETHMRLGSKVHIESFYEMSFLFYRTIVANRIAFLILRRMAGIPNDDRKVNDSQISKKYLIDMKKDNILFYGYASYSKAILTSVTEILRLYRDRESGEWVAFASYQHNLQAESGKIQMYFGIPNKFKGSVDAENRLKVRQKTYVVQIVPISSTLTTFDKMWLMLRQQIEPDSADKIMIHANYTVFWVVNSNGDIVQGKPSEIEEKYWEEVDGQTIHTKFSELEAAGCKSVDYFMRSSVTWQDPLKCEFCYPDNVLEEIPLVETDITSTVPSQQLRPPKNDKKENSTDPKRAAEWQKKNNERLLQLKDCVYYGHICRRQNHYQYYIDTQKYFYKVKDSVKEWLEVLERDSIAEADSPTLHIIFSPEHNTNVGFAQYVNTYYFNGMAEIVSLNVDKEFRSNFICEHSALMKTIEELHLGMGRMDAPPVQFYFVDDTIISGETFDKANSFLHSLLPAEYRDLYGANLFCKVFLLVNRNSEESKSIYVNNQIENYLSFVHIDISNVRTQGDSCIGCKLEQNAQRMFKRSTTTTQAAYWANKIQGYQKNSYDDREAMGHINKENSFNRLLITHVLQNLFVKSINAFEVGEAYQMLLTICMWMLTPDSKWKVQKNLSKEEKKLYGYSGLLCNIKGIAGVKIVLKVVCRPFFIYEFKIRKQILTFYIFWTELVLGKDSKKITEGTSKQFLKINNRIEDTCTLARKYKEAMMKAGESEIAFLQDYLLEGLADMGSTYLFRKQTLKSIYDYFGVNRKNSEFAEVERAFWNSYVVDIQRLLTNSADETKELWLEYFYLSGQEYKQFPIINKVIDLDFKPVFLYEAITGSTEIEEQNYPFYQFCHDIFFHNMGVNFDGLEKKALQQNAEDQKSKEGKYEYFMEYWAMMRKLDSLQGNKDVKRKYTEELKLFNILKEKRNEEGNNESVDTWYENLLTAFICLIHEKYDIDPKQINIAVITENIDKNEFAERIQSLNIVKEELNMCASGKPQARYEIKGRIIQALEKNDGLPFELERNGYTINDWKADDKRQEHYIIIFFDNPEVEAEEHLGRSLKKIERVFLYIGVGKMNFDNDKYQLERQNFYLKMILRDVLTYRNRLLRFLESDFSGEIFSRYARTVGEKSIVSHEKANSHNTTADDEITIEVFVRKDLVKKYQVLDELQMVKWLLLRNYTNGQIAKIFNRTFAKVPWEYSNSDVEIPPLYVDQESTDGVKELFCQKLDVFSKLGINDSSKTDERFAFLQKIVDIDCKDMADAEFIKNENGEYYNLEYFKCIIIDICISAIKYASDRPDYLLRVDNFLYKKQVFKEKDFIQCQVQIFREPSGIEGIDYLVFRNPVDKFSHELGNWKITNESIQRRLTDPLDYIDGHMSLLTIKRYIENINKSVNLKCVFQYVEAADNKWILFFETKLPVLKEK